MSFSLVIIAQLSAYIYVISIQHLKYNGPDKSYLIYESTPI